MRGRSAERAIADVGRRIAELRRGRKLTQEDLADRLKLSVKYVQRVEGGTNLSVRSLVRFAAALGVDVAELFALPGVRTVVRGRPTRSASDPR